MVHTYGLPADATNIKNFCDDNNLKLIEDTAEAHGQLEKRKKCGSFGDVSTLSFYANKHITTGEGGAVLTDSQELYDLMKQIINLDLHIYFNMSFMKISYSIINFFMYFLLLNFLFCTTNL